MIGWGYDCTCVEETLAENGIVPGYFDSTATNFNADATVDNGS